MIKAVVFDLDHTLFDRYATLALVAPMFREKYGFNEGITDEYFTEQICRADRNYVHFGWEKIHEYLNSKNIFKTVPEYEEYREYLLYCFSKVAVPFEFSKPMLAKLRESGLKTGLITNGRHEIQTSKLAMLGLLDSFDEIVISRDTPYSKPDKEIFLLAAERLGVEPCEMMYVGDHPKFDVDGSRLAGCVPVWVKTTGTWVYPEIEKPELQVETVAEIPQIVERINAVK